MVAVAAAAVAAAAYEVALGAVGKEEQVDHSNSFEVEGSLAYFGTVVGTVEDTGHIVAGTADMEASFAVGAAQEALAVVAAAAAGDELVTVAAAAAAAVEVVVVVVVDALVGVVVATSVVVAVAFALLKLVVGWVVEFEHHQEHWVQHRGACQ